MTESNSNRRKSERHNKNNPPDVNRTENLGEAFQKNIRPYIEVIDELRKCGLQNDIKLPNVVVVGDQSSGKSSIIEAISGVQLPRGRGIVTRCPLELQLKRMEGNVKWKGTLSHNGYSVDIDSPEKVSPLIIRAQNEICGGEHNISENLLTLRIESNSKTAPELTLIDLPGIARMAMNGQDPNICERIKKIIEKYVKNENTVILCMISANLDVAVNESLRVAREYDPTNERTLGVITKPDLADNHQKEAMLQLLNNESLKLKKGYRMVKCRCQGDLDTNIPLSEALDNEIKYFKNDTYYSQANHSLLGTMNLANKITTELVEVIKKTIPQLKEDIKNQLQKTEELIQALPTGVPTIDSEKRAYLHTVMYDTLAEIKSLLTRGQYSKKNVYLNWREKYENFQQKLIDIQAKTFSHDFSTNMLQKKLQGARGREICGFLNYELFEDEISKHIQKYQPMALTLLRDLNLITEEALLNVVNSFFGHLLDIKRDINTLVIDALDECVKRAAENVTLIFEEERIPFAMDSTFHEKIKLMSLSKDQDFLNLEHNANMLGKILLCYLKIVLNRLCDIIPMTIRQWIHIKLDITLHASLMRYLSETDSDDKVKENEESRINRTRLTEKRKRLEIAKRSLNQY